MLTLCLVPTRFLSTFATWTHIRNSHQARADAHTAGEDFFTMADDMLTEEVDGAVGPIRVPITTVQALILLVSRLLSTGNQLKSWMLMGTCARMALEMGLHLDAQAFLRGNPQSKLHVLTRNDLYVRAKTFWAVWIFEQE